MGMSHGVGLAVNVDLSKYPFFNGKIEDFSPLPHQGYCNVNYSFQMDGRKYLLREFKVDDVDREFEFQVQTLAYQKNIAAKPIILDEENGLMIVEYIDGHHKETLTQDDIKQLAKLLQKLHSIEIDREPLNLYEDFKQVTQEIKDAFETLSKYPAENVLCHNDLNPKNILFSDDIKFIDWEYAAVNDRYFDLAALCVEFNFSRDEEQVLLENYFYSGHLPSLEKLDAYKTIYAALCKQWFEAHGIK